jgi:hypothetical protein
MSKQIEDMAMIVSRALTVGQTAVRTERQNLLTTQGRRICDYVLAASRKGGLMSVR